MEIDAPSRNVPRPDAALGQCLLPLEPQFRQRVWGGRRLRVSEPPTGEAWLAMGESRVLTGRRAGRTVAELTSKFGPDLLGRAVVERFGRRFPLLAKILDCAGWLSVQVHPNDEQARRMVGPGEFGKTEAWYFLEAEPEARILLGAKPGTTPDHLVRALRDRRAADVAEEVRVAAGDAVLIPAGTLHAIGPGLLLYELQQASDTTYRAYDWDRPESAGRKLQIEESVAVTTTAGPQPLVRPHVDEPGGVTRAIECGDFRLDLVVASPAPLVLGTAGLSFHILTAVAGTAEVSAGGERVRLSQFETVLLAGSAGAYDLRAPEGADAPATVLRASVPG